MKPYDLSTLADGVLREQAVAAVESLRKNGFPKPKDFGRTQMKNLQHIARVEPLQVSKYAKHQHEKLPRDNDGYVRSSHQDIATVWQSVMDCYRGGSKREAWSLDQEGRKYWEQVWQTLDTSVPQGASVEDRQQRNLLKADRKQFQETWLADTVPIFFDHFCIEYVFQITRLLV